MEGISRCRDLSWDISLDEPATLNLPTNQLVIVRWDQAADSELLRLIHWANKEPVRGEIFSDQLVILTDDDLASEV